MEESWGKVPGEKKKIGTAAQRDYEDRKAKGELVVPPFPDDMNCDLDRPLPKEENGVRPSELLIGAAAILPAALKLRARLKRQAANGRTKDAA